MSGSSHVAVKRGGASGNAGISVAQQSSEAEGGGTLQSWENSQLPEVYGEYAISQNILFFCTNSYTSRNSYVAVSFSPPDHRFNLRFLHGQNAVAGRPDTFRRFCLEVGWSFP